MKKFWKVFIICFVAFSLILFSLGAYLYHAYLTMKQQVEIVIPTATEGEPEEKGRLNILFLGVAAYSLADTMILASYDQETKKVDMISIPRDTYLHREGYDSPQQRKINAAFAVGENKAQSAMAAVGELLGVPVHGYVKLDYESVEKIVDAVGPIEVQVERRMSYRDPRDTPPLVIDFSVGTHLLDGEAAVKYLRYREPIEADVGRIKRHQDFILKLVDQSKSIPKLYQLIEIAKDHVETSVSLAEMMGLVPAMLRLETEEIQMVTLPGRPETRYGLSFYIVDQEETRRLVGEIYGDELELAEPEVELVSEPVPVNATTGGAVRVLP